MNGTPFNEREDQHLRERYRIDTARTIAAALGRCESSVYQRAKRLGLTTSTVVKVNVERLKELHAAGYSDREIADEFKASRERVRDVRERLGLPSNAFSERRIDRVRAKTREQLDAAGLPSLGALRVAVFRQRAIEAGWPADLRPRAVQILNLLYERGPMVRRDIAEAIGMPWKGSRKSLVSNDKEGSYLAHLQARGLVVRLWRIVQGSGNKHGTGQGKNVCLYALPLHVEPNFGGSDERAS